MTTFAVICQVVIALGIFNVWIIRRDRSTPFRPEGAGDIAEEFRRYGFPDWFRVVIGSTKVMLAILLLVGVFFAQVALPAAALMALLMVGAIVAHVRVQDPPMKSMPALAMLVMSVVVVVTYAA